MSGGWPPSASMTCLTVLSNKAGYRIEDGDDEMDCKIRRTKKNPNDYNVAFKGLTRGSIMALKNALECHSTTGGSSIAGDLLAFFVDAIRTSEDPEIVRAVLDAPELEASCSIAPPPMSASSDSVE